MLGTVQGTGNIAESKQTESPCLHGAYILVEAINKINNLCVIINMMLGSIKCYGKKEFWIKIGWVLLRGLGF